MMHGALVWIKRPVLILGCILLLVYDSQQFIAIPSFQPVLHSTFHSRWGCSNLKADQERSPDPPGEKVVMKKLVNQSEASLFESAFSRVSNDFVIRTAVRQDIYPIACLCLEAFEREYKWWESLEMLSQRREYASLLAKRLAVADSGKRKHSLIVATTKAGDSQETVEVGYLPPPPGYAPPEEELPPPPSWLGVELPRPPLEVPFLGNLAVAENFQRQGLGAALVGIGATTAAKLWSEKKVFVAVKKGNQPAIALYEALGFLVHHSTPTLNGEEDNMVETIGGTSTAFADIPGYPLIDGFDSTTPSDKSRGGGGDRDVLYYYFPLQNHL
ncbi:unnamed protein product [Heterosigma akashiwo]